MIFTSLLTKMLRIAMQVTCRIISELISGAKMKVKLIHLTFYFNLIAMVMNEFL